MTTRQPSGALVIRDYRGRPFFEAKWRDTTRRQVKRRLGPAWVERDAAGSWVKRSGRVRDGHLDERAAYVEMHRLIEEHEAELEQAPQLDHAPTFDEAAADWLHHLEHVEGAKPSTLRNYRAMLTRPGVKPRKRGREPKARVMREFGGRELRAITTARVEKWLAGIDGEGVSKRSVNAHRQLVCSVLQHAVDRPAMYGLTVNVARATSKRRESDPGVLDYFEPEEVLALARAAREGRHRDPRRPAVSEAERHERHMADAQDAALLVTAAFTGLRLGELLALRWRDVNMTGGALTVAGALSAGERTAPKSRKPRTVPLSTLAAAELARLAERDRFTSRDDSVFGGPLGEPLDPSALRRRYRRALTAAELRRLRLHDLRHTFGSLAVRGGVDIATLKSWMGHAKIATTERYLHAKPRTDDVARLDRAFVGQVGEFEPLAA